MKNKINNMVLLQSIFESSVEGILVLDNKGNIQAANTASEQLFGYQKGALVNKNMELLIPSGFKHIYTAYKKTDAKKLVAKTTNIDADLCGTKKDGTKFNLDLSISQATDQNKNAMLVFLRNSSKCRQDITEINEKLKETNRKFDALINNLHGIAYRCKNNKNWEMIYISKGCLDLTGYDFTVFKEHKKHYGQIILEEDRDLVWDKIQHAISNKKPYNLEYRIKNSNGQIKYVWEKGEAVYNEQNKIVALEGFISDITEQKQIEQELKISEAKNKAILKNIPDIMFVNNKHGVYLEVHASDPSLLVEPKESTIGKKISDILPKHLCEKIMTAFTTCESTKEVKTLQFSLPIKGVIKYFEARIVAKDNGNFLTVMRDVSPSKKEELSKEKTREILEMIIQHQPLKEITYKITETIENQIHNSVASILLLEGKKQTLHILAAPNLPDNFSKVIEGMTIESKEGSCENPDFLKKNVIVSDISTDSLCENYKTVALENNLKSCWSFPILSSARELLGTFAIYSKASRKPTKNEMVMVSDMAKLASIAIEQHSTDIDLQQKKKQLENYALKLKEKVLERTNELNATVQKMVESTLNLEDQIQVTQETESKLKESKNMFSAIAKNFPRGIITVFDKNFKILYSKGEGLKLAGLENIPLTGKTVDEIDVFTEDRKARLKQDISKTLAGEHFSREIEINNIMFSISTTPLYDTNNKISRALLVHNDISHQKNVERNIQDALEKELELNELKSLFISTASHEFRTPLSVILSSASLIERQNKPGKEEEREKYVNKIKANVKNLVIILNDFLSLSKLEEGKVISQLEWFDIISFSETLINEFKPSLKRKQKVTIIKNAAPINVFLDPKLMRHILHNLLSNASKYSAENKDIIIRITTNSEHILLKIEDQGIGIPEEEQKNMFQRFFRAKNACNIQGTGLGLNIVKQYTELMGGTVSFESQLHEGSTFTLEFPVNKK